MTSITSRLIFIAILSALLNGCAERLHPAPITSNNIATLHSPVIAKIETTYYQVKKGDTLYSISLLFDLDYRQLAQWNRIAPPYTIEIGQKIRLFNTSIGSKPTNNAMDAGTVAETKQKIVTATATNRPGSQTLLNKIPPNNEPNLAYRPSYKTYPLKNPTEKYGSSPQKKSIISIDNENMLKLNFQWPLKGKVLKTFSQADNKGVDIAGEIGQEVSAAEAGKVVYSGQGLIGYGNLLILKHNDLYLSAYANNSQLLVTEGHTVEKGEVIAKVGQAGLNPAKSDQPSLHFEIRKNGKPVNPLNFLPEK
ncbi:MAG: LysM peptidoglycan-binding domain-containing protein [Methylobacter sp.]|nr:MAG: LysM peptidoglycan-binding domain-containing protein [Methylobacter sp.]